ncbi:hypothetical protein [Streptomyces jumonjinensis]|uniref:hypothetical protein n=1 Tax=Streptomyces jumonjinensis TaxID=1945 RepID=UPI0037B479E7
MRQPFRIDPKMPPASYKTYSIVTPVSTHFRPATCAEVACPDHEHGWRVRVEGLPPELLHTARTNGRKYIEVSITESETWLMFEAGQPCFRATEHRLPLDRPALYVVSDGDWRGNPRGTPARRHDRAEHWVEDFADHQQQLADTAQKG